MSGGELGECSTEWVGVEKCTCLVLPLDCCCTGVKFLTKCSNATDNLFTWSWMLAFTSSTWLQLSLSVEERLNSEGGLCGLCVGSFLSDDRSDGLEPE